MGRRNPRFLIALIAALALVAAACGGGDDDTASAGDGAAASDDGSGDGAAVSDDGSGDGAAVSDDGSGDGGAVSDDGSGDGGAVSDDGSGDGGAASDDGSGDGGAASDDGSGDGGASESGIRSLDLVPDGETDILGNPAGQGYVELDGVRYDFVLNGACQKIFGAVQAAGQAADGSGGGVDAFIPPENWESFDDDRFDPPTVTVSIGEDDEWIAETGVEEFVGTEYRVLTPDESAVTSFTNDGSFTEGEGIFFSRFNSGEIETLQGSFGFYCP